MLDLMGLRSEGDGTLEAVKMKRDAAVEGGLLFDIELALDITSEEDAEIVGRVIPGAVEIYQKAMDARAAGEAETALSGAAAGAVAASGLRGNSAWRVASPHVDLELSTVENSKVVLSKVGAEIVDVRLRASGKKLSYMARFRLNGLKPPAAQALADAFIARTVSVSFERRQQVIPFPTAKRPEVEIGMAVAGRDEKGVEFAGLVIGRSADADDKVPQLEVEDFEKTFVVPESAVTGAFRVVPEDGKTMAATLKRFHATVRKLGKAPSWRDIIPTIGSHYAAGSSPVGDACVVSFAIVDETVERLRAEKKQQAEA